MLGIIAQMQQRIWSETNVFPRNLRRRRRPGSFEWCGIYLARKLATLAIPARSEALRFLVERALAEDDRPSGEAGA